MPACGVLKQVHGQSLQGTGFPLRVDTGRAKWMQHAGISKGFPLPANMTKWPTWWAGEDLMDRWWGPDGQGGTWWAGEDLMGRGT